MLLFMYRNNSNKTMALKNLITIKSHHNEK